LLDRVTLYLLAALGSVVCFGLGYVAALATIHAAPSATVAAAPPTETRSTSTAAAPAADSPAAISGIGGFDVPVKRVRTIIVRPGDTPNAPPQPAAAPDQR
jgi:hypothetical protein